MTMRRIRKPGWGPVIGAVLTILLGVGPAPSQDLQSRVEYLSDPSLAGRRSGTPGAAEAAAYILEQFETLGLDSEYQQIDAGRRNVVARLGDSEPHIIVGAHYDGQGGRNPGASDNAAGVAVMLELAGAFAAAPPAASIVFVAFDDEEQGLNGSRFYAANPRYPLEDTRAVVILDTMGRSFVDLDQWALIVLGTERSTALATIVADHRDQDTMAIGTDLIGARSDFAPFATRGVPYLFFTNATHADYHGTGDTPDRIRFDELADDVATIRAVITDIAALDEDPVFLDTPEYPPLEANALGEMLTRVEESRAVDDDFRVLFADARRRLEADPGRVNLRLATELLLGAATPRFSFFSLAYMLAPLYESEGAPDLALAAYRAALDVAPDAGTRAGVESRIEDLARSD